MKLSYSLILRYFLIFKNLNHAIFNKFYVKGLSSISSSKNWDNKIFLFNLLSCSLFIYYTPGVIKIEQLEDISKMTEMSTKMIKNKNHEHDNPDYLWILRDFDFEENDPKAYFEDQIKNYKQFGYFKNRHCSFLPFRNKMDDNYTEELKKLKNFIFDSLLRKKSLNNTFMNGAQVAEFFSQIIKQLNEISVVNYADLDITFHNTAKDNLRDIKSKFETKLNILKNYKLTRGDDELHRALTPYRLPINWNAFNQFVVKLKRECLDELKSKLKQDPEFQKEYVEEYSRFADDQILILKAENKEKLEKLHRGILNDLLDQFIKELDLYQYNDSKLEIKLVEIENNYKSKGIESIEMEKVYKEQFLHYCETVKMVLEKTWIQEALHLFCKTLMSQFPLEKGELTKESDKAKNHEIKKLREKVKNDDTFHKLKQILEKQLEEEFNQIKSFNIIPAPQTNSNKTYDIFLSYSHKIVKEEINGFREKLNKHGFNVWHDNLFLPKEYGQDTNLALAEAIGKSKIFLFIYNIRYSNSPSCMREFNWACHQKNIKILGLELEKNEDKRILFALGDNNYFKAYKTKDSHNGFKLSEIAENDLNNLIQSIKKLLGKI